MHFILLFFFLSFSSAKFYNLGFYALPQENLGFHNDNLKEILFEKASKKLYLLPTGSKGGEVKTRKINLGFEVACKNTNPSALKFCSKNFKKIIEDFMSDSKFKIDMEIKKKSGLFFFFYFNKFPSSGRFKFSNQSFTKDLYLFCVYFKSVDFIESKFKCSVKIVPFDKITLNYISDFNFSQEAYSCQSIIDNSINFFKVFFDQELKLNYFKTSGFKRKNNQRGFHPLEKKRLKTRDQNDNLADFTSSKSCIEGEFNLKELCKNTFKRKKVNHELKDNFINVYDYVEIDYFTDSLFVKDSAKSFYEDLNFSLESELVDVFSCICEKIHGEAFGLNENKVISLSIPYFTDSDFAILDLCILCNYSNSTGIFSYDTFWVYKEKDKKNIVSPNGLGFKKFKFHYSFKSLAIPQIQNSRELFKLQLEEKSRFKEQIIQDLRLRLNEFEQEYRFPEKFNKKTSENESDTKKVSQFDLTALLFEDQDNTFLLRMPENFDGYEVEQEHGFSENINQGNDINFDLESFQQDHGSQDPSSESSNNFDVRSDGDEVDMSSLLKMDLLSDNV